MYSLHSYSLNDPKLKGTPMVPKFRVKFAFDKVSYGSKIWVEKSSLSKPPIQKKIITITWPFVVKGCKRTPMIFVVKQQCHLLEIKVVFCFQSVRIRWRQIFIVLFFSYDPIQINHCLNKWSYTMNKLQYYW